MKMNIGIMFTACLTLFATSIVYAGTGTTSAAGALVTIDAANNDSTGGNLTFTPSPTSVMGWNTSARAFTIVSMSINNVGNENGFAYCTASTGNNIFKQSLTTYTAIAAPSDAGTTVDGFE